MEMCLGFCDLPGNLFIQNKETAKIYHDMHSKRITSFGIIDINAKIFDSSYHKRSIKRILFCDIILSQRQALRENELAEWTS